jgi:hypothetical protein
MATFSLPRVAILGAVILWAAQVGGTTFPATVEVDLIFPRNDTYAPSTLFPIVFAFQNAALAYSLSPSFDLNIWDIADENNSWGPLYDTYIDWNNSSDTTYAYRAINLNTTDNGAARTYSIGWVFGSFKCSNATGQVTIGSGSRANNALFTIESGAQQPDLVAATANSSSCDSMSHLAFNVTDTLDVPNGTHNDIHDRCVVLSDVQPLVTGNPCAVRFDSATASSISAAITSAACATKHASCPSQNAAPGRWDTRYTGYTVWTTAFGALMAAFVVMECL